jgi:integrase
MATIRKRNGKYQAQVRRIGQPHISRTFLEHKDARQWARQIELAADRHDLPATADRKQMAVTLGALVQRYKDAVVVHKRSGVTDCVVLTNFALHPICRKTVSELRTSDFAEYRDQRLREVSPVTLKRELNPVHHLFEVARDEWGIPLKENPLDKLKLQAPDQRRERRLKPGELDKLIQEARKCRGLSRLVAPIILFAVETGMRRGEILAMKREHIDSVNRCLFIPEAKNGHARTIPLTDKALAVLQSVDELKWRHKPADHERVFPMSANCLRLAWERVRDRAKVVDLHFHDLRHEAISRFFERGLTTPEAALISGHSDLRMLFRYSHATRETALAKLNA